MELETPGYTRPLGGLGSSVCIPRHRSVSPTNRQLESSSSSSALRDGPPLRLQPRPLGVIKDDNFINCMSAGAARGAPPRRGTSERNIPSFTRRSISSLADLSKYFCILDASPRAACVAPGRGLSRQPGTFCPVERASGMPGSLSTGSNVPPC